MWTLVLVTAPDAEWLTKGWLPRKTKGACTAFPDRLRLPGTGCGDSLHRAASSRALTHPPGASEHPAALALEGVGPAHSAGHSQAVTVAADGQRGRLRVWGHSGEAHPSTSTM